MPIFIYKNKIIKKEIKIVKMAGNNAIQILRANSATIANSSETLLDGQLLYNTDKNYLTCGGGGNNKPVNSLPVVCQELAIYSDDEVDIQPNMNKVAWVHSNGYGNMDIYAASNLNVTSSNYTRINAALINIEACAPVSSLHPAINISGYPGVRLNCLTSNILLAPGTITATAISAINIKCDVNAGTGSEVNYPLSYANFSTAGITISSAIHNYMGSGSTGTAARVDLYTNGAINISTAGSLGTISMSTLANVYINTPVISLGNTITSFINLNAYRVNINQSGNIITFPNKSGTVALTSDIPVTARRNSSTTGSSFTIYDFERYNYAEAYFRGNIVSGYNSANVVGYIVGKANGYIDKYGYFIPGSQEANYAIPTSDYSFDVRSVQIQRTGSSSYNLNVNIYSASEGRTLDINGVSVVIVTTR